MFRFGNKDLALGCNVHYNGITGSHACDSHLQDYQPVSSLASIPLLTSSFPSHLSIRERSPKIPEYHSIAPPSLPSSLRGYV